MISGWETDGSTMKTQLQLSNLVDDGNEYQFVLCVSQKENLFIIIAELFI